MNIRCTGRIRKHPGLMESFMAIAAHDKKNNAKNKGLVVDKIEDLKCARHPGAKFSQSKEPIPASNEFFTSDEDGFRFKVGWTYFCEECLKLEEEVDPDKRTKAYDCPFCQIVYGKFKENKVILKTSGSEDPLKEKESVYYLCRICDSQLGKEEYLVNF